MLPTLLAKITRKPRYRPEIEWSKKSWTHNIFRFYELIFGRKVGIRAEASYFTDGRVELYTFEAWCAFIETWLRRSLKFEYVKVYQLQLNANPYGYSIPMASFAIAHDADATSGDKSASPFTWSHTVTGSNPLLAVGVTQAASSQPTATSGTYNSVSLTKATSKQQTSSGGTTMEASVWLLGNPSTGANTVSISATIGTSGHAGGGSTSYTGCQSGSTADASSSAGGTGSGSQSMTVTTVADNCWVFAVGQGNAVISPTCAANQTSRGTVSVAYSIPCVLRIEDNNAAKTPAGAVTMGFTIGGTSVQGFVMAGASFAPAGVTNPNVTVSDSSAVTENVSVKIDASVAVSDSSAVTEFSDITRAQSRDLTVSDSTAVTENILLMAEAFISKSESSTVTENIVTNPVSFVTTSDSSTVTENILRMAEEFVNKLDSSAVTENVSVIIFNRLITVSDSSAVTDAVALTISNQVNTSDSSTVSENIVVGVNESVLVSDTSGVTENVSTPSVSYQINKSDSSTVTENSVVSIAAVGDLSVSTSDATTVTESTGLFELTSVSVNDASTVTENVNLLKENFVSVSDTTGVTENTALLNIENTAVSDTSSVTENINLLLPNLFTSVSDATTVTESTGLLTEDSIKVSDSSTLSENNSVTTSNLNLNVLVNDTITVTEFRKTFIEGTPVSHSPNVIFLTDGRVAIKVSPTVYLPL